MSGVVSKDHVHMHIEYPFSFSISELPKRLKSRSFGLLQHEYTELHKSYLGKQLWVICYGAWNTGNITDEMVQECLKHRKTIANDRENFIIA